MKTLGIGELAGESRANHCRYKYDRPYSHVVDTPAKLRDETCHFVSFNNVSTAVSAFYKLGQ